MDFMANIAISASNGAIFSVRLGPPPATDLPEASSTIPEGIHQDLGSA
jgi:hypothetical protein